MLPLQYEKNIGRMQTYMKVRMSTPVASIVFHYHHATKEQTLSPQFLSPSQKDLVPYRNLSPVSHSVPNKNKFPYSIRKSSKPNKTQRYCVLV